MPLCGSGKELHLEYLSGSRWWDAASEKGGDTARAHSEEKQGLQEWDREPHLGVTSGSEKRHSDSLPSDRAGWDVPFQLLLHWARLESWRGASYLFLIKQGHLLLSYARSVFIKCQLQAAHGGRPRCPSHSEFPAKPFKALRCQTIFSFVICCSRFSTLLVPSIKMHGPAASRSPDSRAPKLLTVLKAALDTERAHLSQMAN